MNAEGFSSSTIAFKYITKKIIFTQYTDFFRANLHKDLILRLTFKVSHKCHLMVVGIIQNVPIYMYLLFQFSNEFERLQGKEADCNLLLKTDFHHKNL